VIVGVAAAGTAVAEALSCEEPHAEAVEDARGLAASCASEAPGVVILAGEGPPPRAPQIAALRAAAPAAAVVVVCGSAEGWELRELLAAGAAGLVLSADVRRALVPCLAAVRAGQISVPWRNRRQLERPVLSTREKQILGLVVMGYLNSQIAKRLYLAESTVKSHLTSAFAKLEVRSRNEAVDLILDPERGLALGILALDCEPVQQRAGEPLRRRPLTSQHRQEVIA
jgi:DNA-binding NarL/FixJ family response regulator